MLDGIITYSGTPVTLTAGVPTIEDIARALARMPRFGGHTRRIWSVLNHSLYVSALAEGYAAVEKYGPVETTLLQLVALLHDAHEALTGDVPTPFKTAALREIQDQVDRRIFAAYVPGGVYTALAFVPDVKKLDARALYAEAFVVGPPLFRDVRHVHEYMGAAPELADVQLLLSAERTGNFGVDESVNAPSVFLRRYAALRSQIPTTERPRCTSSTTRRNGKRTLTDA